MMDPEEKAKRKQEKKFKKLPEEWREDMIERKDADIDAAIKKAAVNLVQLDLAKEQDDDLLKLKEQLAVANAQYTDGKKVCLIQIEFLAEVLRGRGRDVPDIKDLIKGAKTEDAGE